MEKISEEKYRSNKIYIICLEISNNCTNSENAIIPFISSSVSSKIIEEVLELYNNIETITSNPDIKSFLQNSIRFSKLLRIKLPYRDVIFSVKVSLLIYLFRML